jgi:hypothetical protein
MFSHKKWKCNFIDCVFDSLPGSVSKHEFQAETKKLLDIVARSLYSEKEVGCMAIALRASQGVWQGCPHPFLGKPNPAPLLAVKRNCAHPGPPQY